MAINPVSPAAEALVMLQNLPFEQKIGSLLPCLIPVSAWPGAPYVIAYLVERSFKETAHDPSPSLSERAVSRYQPVYPAVAGEEDSSLSSTNPAVTNSEERVEKKLKKWSQKDVSVLKKSIAADPKLSLEKMVEFKALFPGRTEEAIRRKYKKLRANYSESLERGTSSATGKADRMGRRVLGARTPQWRGDEEEKLKTLLGSKTSLYTPFLLKLAVEFPGRTLCAIQAKAYKLIHSRAEKRARDEDGSDEAKRVCTDRDDVAQSAGVSS